MAQPHREPTMWIPSIYASLGILAVAVIVAGITRQSDALIAAGIVGLFAAAALCPIALSSARAARGGSSSTSEHTLAQLVQSIRSMSEQQALSSDARRVINRRRERELLTRAIEEDMSARDYDAAMILVKELAERFGYRADAEDFRRRIDRERAATREQQVQEGIRQVDALIVRAQWHDAAEQADRVARLYPDSPRIEGLRHRVADARDRYKSEVERRFLHAAEAERIDEAMDLLKELDHYLTEEEAARYTEVARGVIGKARENLGARFKLAVQDRHWRDAEEVGERIIREFPNSRMAAEVRQLIDHVRERARVVIN